MDDLKLKIGFWLAAALFLISGIAGLLSTNPVDGIG